MVRDASTSILGRLSQAPPANDDARTVHFNTSRVNEHHFANNKIRTALYNVWNFVPKGIIYEEFSRLANSYFAVVVLLQFLPQTTNTGGISYTVFLLTFMVLFASFLKAKQDLKRHRADHAANTAKTQRYDPASKSFKQIMWSDVAVGDILKVANREMLPADIVLLCTFEPNPSNPQGACFVETKSLDGETNLKGRSVPTPLVKACGGTLASQTAAVGTVAGMVECEKPNAATSKFVGKLVLEGSDDSTVLGINNVLLRGSSLRNTAYVLGLVINTGIDTKVMQGARKPPLKRSQIDLGINKIMMCVMAVQARAYAPAPMADAHARPGLHTRSPFSLGEDLCAHRAPCVSARLQLLGCVAATISQFVGRSTPTILPAWYLNAEDGSQPSVSGVQVFPPF